MSIDQLIDYHKLKLGDTICHYEGGFIGEIKEFKQVFSRRSGKWRLKVIVSTGDEYFASDVAYVPSPEVIAERAAECRAEHMQHMKNLKLKPWGKQERDEW